MGRDDGEREKRSWREIDRRREGGRTSDEAEPRGEAARARASLAAKRYTKRIDGLFSAASGGQQGDDLRSAVKQAHGTDKLAAACATYAAALGMPDEPSVLSMFLDSGNPDLVVGALEHWNELRRAGGPPLTKGQKTQVRTLALHSNNAVADAAEALLETL